MQNLILRRIRNSLFIVFFLTLISISTTILLAIATFNDLKSIQEKPQQIQDVDLSNLESRVKLLNTSINNPLVLIPFTIAGSPKTYFQVKTALNKTTDTLAKTVVALEKHKATKNTFTQDAQFFIQPAKAATSTLFALSKVRFTGFLKPLDSKYAALREKSTETATAVSSAYPLLAVIPEMAGDSKERNYLIAFQNSAEARGTGGLIGAYAVMKVDKGKITFSKFGANTDLKSLDDVPIKLPPEYTKFYNDDPGMWVNSNLSPHFPYGAKIWLELWKLQYNQKLDGVFTFDPIALSDLLKITGPVRVQGIAINDLNVVKITLSDLYEIYKNDNYARKEFLKELIREMTVQLLNPNLSKVAIAKALIPAINENRILFFSANEVEQKQIETSKISGSIQIKADNMYRMVIQNIAGNKMDYYLRRNLTLRSLECGKKSETEVTFSVTNDVQPDLRLPSYVAGRLDLKMPQGDSNSHGVRVIILAPIGSHIISMRDLATSAKFGYLVRERKHPGIAVDLDLRAKETKSFQIVFGGGVGRLETHIQPLVIEQETRIFDKCR